MSDERRKFWTTPAGVTWISVAVNILLSAAKIAVGVLCRSQALVADGLHSWSDLATDVPVLAGLRVANRPADDTHHYGHLRVNTLMGLIIGAILLGVGGVIAYNAINSLHTHIHGHEPAGVEAGLPFWVALASAPVKELLFRLMRAVGRKASNPSVIANAWHSRVDALAAAATAVGLGGVIIGGPTWGFLDPLTAIVLAAFIVVVAAKIMGSAASELIDRAPGKEVLANIEKALAETEGVRGFHAFRARKLGGKVEMDVHVQVDPELTVAAGHDIAAEVRRRVQQADRSVVQVIVHVEPAGEGGD